MAWTAADVIQLVGIILTGIAAIYAAQAKRSIEHHEDQAERRKASTDAALEATAGLVSAHEKRSQQRMSDHEVEAERRSVTKAGARKPALEPGRCPTCGRKKPAAKSLVPEDEFCEGEG